MSAEMDLNSPCEEDTEPVSRAADDDLVDGLLPPTLDLFGFAGLWADGDFGAQDSDSEVSDVSMRSAGSATHSSASETEPGSETDFEGFEGFETEDDQTADQKTGRTGAPMAAPRKLSELRAEDLFAEQVVIDAVEADVVVCARCKTRCMITETSLICESCGEERSLRLSQVSSNDTYNTNSSSYMPYHVTGHGAREFTRSLMKCSDSVLYQKTTALRKLNWLNDHAARKLPKNAVAMSAELYYNVKVAVGEANKAYKGKSGLLAACVWKTCNSLLIGRSHADVALFMNIETRVLFSALAIFEDLVLVGVLKTHAQLSPVAAFVNRYVHALDVPSRYCAFLVELIEATELSRTDRRSDCRDSTKCAGALLMLAVRAKLPSLTRERIQEVCGVSRSTFTKYYRTLFSNHIVLKPIFKRHGVPMDKAWRETASP